MNPQTIEQANTDDEEEAGTPNDQRNCRSSCSVVRRAVQHRTDEKDFSCENMVIELLDAKKQVSIDT